MQEIEQRASTDPGVNQNLVSFCPGSVESLGIKKFISLPGSVGTLGVCEHAPPGSEETLGVIKYLHPTTGSQETLGVKIPRTQGLHRLEG